MPGLSNYGAQLAMDAVLPDAAAYHVALFTTLPDEGGAGGVECAGGSYARVAHAAWEDFAHGGDGFVKANNGAITFPVFTAPFAIVGWGIFDAGVAGNLIAFGPLRDGDSEAITRNTLAGDQVKFNDNDLKVGIGVDTGGGE